MAEQRWIGVYESMPTMRVKKSSEEGGRDYLESDCVLVWDGRRIEIAQAVSDECGLYWIGLGAEVVATVSWMPLPAPPEK